MRCFLLAFIIALSLVISAVKAETIYVSGDVSGTWSADTVIVTDEVRVPPGESLTIEPGVEVLFFVNCKFIVDQDAILTAAGTVTDSILFNEFNPGNHWKGIRLLNASDSTRFEYCWFRNSIATGSAADENGGAIYSSTCDFIITNCTIFNCKASGTGGGIFLSQSNPIIQDCIIDSCSTGTDGAGIFCTDASPYIHNNTIIENYTGFNIAYNNGAGGGICCKNNSSPIISENNIIGNIGGTNYGYGGGINCTDSDPTIINNDISGNKVQWSGKGGGIYCSNSMANISNNTINNNAGYGGGIYCTNSSPTIIDNEICNNYVLGIWSGGNSGGIKCENNSNPLISGNNISNNSVPEECGGIYCNNSSPDIINNIIGGNFAPESGGGIYLENNSAPQIINNVIKDNSTNQQGGGIYCTASCDPIIELNEVSGNTSSGFGGGIYFENNAPALNKNTIVSNSGSMGGGIYCNNSSPTIVNCILWDNIPQQVHQVSGSNAQISYSDLAQFWPSPTCINTDPFFIDAINGDYHLSWANFPIPDSTMSPCIDSGDPASPADPDGTLADMGCYYFDQSNLPPMPQIELSAYELDFGEVPVGEISDLPLTIHNIGDSTLVLYEIYSDNTAYWTNYNPADSLITPGDSLELTVYFEPQGIGTAIGLLTIENSDTITIVVLEGEGLGGVSVDGYCFLENQTNHEGTKVLFQADSPGAVTDSNYTDSSGYYQINVEPGIYDVLFTHEGFYGGELLNQGLFTATLLDSVLLEEIPVGIPLSGDISGVLYDTTYIIVGDAVVPSGLSLTIMPGASILFDGYYRIDIDGLLTAIGTETDSIIFTNTNSEVYFSGIFVNNSANDSTKFKYCRISNYGFYAPTNVYGIYCSNSNPTIEECLITGNFGWSNGAGIYCNNSNALISQCIIAGNGGVYNGGGIYCSDASPTISECIIQDNGGEHGGGIYTTGNSSPLIVKCLLLDNGGYWGGGIYCCSTPIIDRCTIGGSSSVSSGGGVYCDWGANPTIKNTAIYGGVGSVSGIHFMPTAGTINHCNFYSSPNGAFSGNVPAFLGQTITTNSNGDSCDVFFNIFEDPLFADPLNGNFNLTWANFPIPDSTMSPCIDAGDPASPADPDGTTADMGAHYYNQGLPPVLPEIELSAASIEFGEVPLTTQSNINLTVYSIGDTTLELYNAAVSDPAFTTNFAPVSLEPEDSLVITITFTPDSIRNYSAVMTIQSNAEEALVSFSGEGVSPVAAIITPYNPPIVVPAGGGSFDFNIAAANLTPTTQIFDLWTQIFLPENGTIEIMSITDFPLSGNSSVNRDRIQNVPAFAPAGTYYYYEYIGDYPWIIEDVDYFTFTKSGTDGGGYLGTAEDWLCTGEPFDGEITAAALPERYALYPAFPNPFNPMATIRFELPDACEVSLIVHDIQGREVQALVTGHLLPGYHQAVFDGGGLASGVYFARLQAGNFLQTNKLLLLK